MPLDGNEKQTIKDKLGDRADKLHPLGPRCVVAVYERPEKSKGGIYFTDTTRREDKAQSKTGLLLRTGVTAFSEDDAHDWGGQAPKIGDWVAFRVGDTVQMECGDVRLRVIEDVDIIMVVDEPDVIY